MARITILGGTGYAGSHIAQEASSRGHAVTSVSRHEPAEAVPNVDYLFGDVTDTEFLASAIKDADVVIEALSPRGALVGRVRGVVAVVADLVSKSGARLGVIGGAGSLQVAEDGPRLSSTPDFPEAFKAEALELGEVLDDLRASASEVDWFFVSPAANFGSFNPGSHTGTFRIGGDVLLADDQGVSNISGADLAQAVVDEVENPAHRRSRFTVAY